MKRRTLLRMATAFLLSSLWCVPDGTAQSPGVAEGNVITGVIHIEEISGAAFLPGDRLLVVSDEEEAVFLLERASQRLLTGNVAQEDFQEISLKDQFKGDDGKTREVDDLEDVAWDRQSHVFLVTSHSRNRRGRSPAKRSAILRLTLGADGLKPDKVFDLREPPDLQEARERTPAQAGFNIEGAAWNQDGRLVLGLRSPTRTMEDDQEGRESNEDAIMLEVKELCATTLNPAAVKPALNLKGGGIRGMFYDPDEHGFWIVAGLSPDPADGIIGKANWTLWFQGDDGTLKEKILDEEVKDGLANVEAVTRGSIGEAKQPHLLLVEDGLRTSRYVLIPIPKVKVPASP